MSLGYSTIMYGNDELDTAIGDIGACQYDGIEVNLDELQQLGVDETSHALDEHDLDVYCVMGVWFESDDEVQTLADGASLAADLGAEFFGLLPPRRGLVEDETLDRWLTEICDTTATAGVTPVLHNHGATHVEGPDEIETWLDRGPDELELLLDTAHYYPYGSITDGIERFADDLAYVHLKDIDTPAGFETYVEDLSAASFNLDSVINYFRSFTDPGDGELDIAAIFETLETVGFEGPVTIEVENQIQDPLVHAKKNRDYYVELTN